MSFLVLIYSSVGIDSANRRPNNRVVQIIWLKNQVCIYMGAIAVHMVIYIHNYMKGIICTWL